MSAHFAELDLMEPDVEFCSAPSDRGPALVGDREGVAAAKGILTAGMLSLPIWLVLAVTAYIAL